MRGDNLSQGEFIYVFQKGFNFSQDGPGNRLVYHLSGCNLSCPWCSNPEGMKVSPNALKYTPDELVEEALASRMMFFDGGGVTFTGGECACQKDVLLKTIKALKEEGINTCIETNASLENCEALYSEVDFMIADYKSADASVLKEVTGAEKRIVFENLRGRALFGLPLLVRIPLIKGFNTGEKNAHLFSEDLKCINASSPAGFSVEILTYHEFGKEKWEKLGLTYTPKDAFVSENDVRILKNALENAGLRLITT